MKTKYFLLSDQDVIDLSALGYVTDDLEKMDQSLIYRKMAEDIQAEVKQAVFKRKINTDITKLDAMDKLQLPPLRFEG